MRRKFATTLALTLAVGYGAIAQSSAQEDESTPIRLSLAEAVARALENNLEIAVARLDPARSHEDVTIADAAFDPQLEAFLLYNDQTDEPTSVFSATGNKFKQGQVQWIDPSRSGGSLTAQLSHSESNSKFPGGAADVFGLVTQNFGASVSVSYTQPLLRNLGLSINQTQIVQAQNNLRISEEQFRDRVLQIVEDVEGGYWELLGAQRQLEVSRESLDLAKDFLAQTKIKVDVGTLPPIEITTADAEVASRDEDVIVNESAVQSAEDGLRGLLHFPGDSPDWLRQILPIDEPTFEHVDVDLEQSITDAMQRRSAILEAELALKNAQLNERFQRNQLKPDLSITGSYRVSGNSFEAVPAFERNTTTLFFDPDTDLFLYGAGDPRVTETTTSVTAVQELRGRGAAFSELYDSDNTNLSVTLNLSLPIKNRRAKAEHARARVGVDQASLQLESARQALRIEVRQAVRDVETADRRVASARANAALQRRKLDAEQKRYENGISTAFQVLEFQNDLQQAESREIRAIIDYNKSLAHLERVKGTLIDQRNIQFR